MIDQDTAYQNTLEYLYGFVDYSLTRQLRYSPDKFDLHRMKEFMSLLGNPHRDYPTIHVAGTKGKGSICALISSVLNESGFLVGLYTSPHLHEYTERININGIDISKKDFVELVEEIKPVIGQVKNLSTFEITTALAFVHFKRKKVDLAVVEVGLGGRLDATNVITPILSIISTISKDHEKVLGNTLEKIAVEKAGIIKKGVPVIISQQKPRIKRVFSQIAKMRSAPIQFIQEELSYKSINQNIRGQDFSITTQTKDEYEFHLPLLGIHQIQNAMTALAALKILISKGYKISKEQIIVGFKNVKWPARFEVLSENPLLIIDCAHNTDSMRKLIGTLRAILPDKKIILVFGASEDKDVAGMLKYSLPEVDQFIATQSTHPRAMNSATILMLIQKMSKNGIEFHSMEKALEKAGLIWNENAVILVAGSIFVAAAAREIWHKILKNGYLK
jgi:dihydrofolate synthase / folylpolyglutamate synthase